MGSNGRREAVLSSDVDSAVAFVDGTTDEQMAAYRAVFATVDVTLANAGLTSDKHGVSARSAAMSRTHTQWREAAHHWLLDPAEDKGAIMTSLLVDGRPIYGDPGLAAISTIFRDLREHPLTMRLLLIDALARRATLRSAREAPWRRSAHFDIKGHALLPLVNLARWSGLTARSTALSTVDRLHDAAGTPLLPDDTARTLAEVFEVLQRLRLRYQLLQLQEGRRPSDEVTFDLMSPIDRSIVVQAVREISTAQRRMANVAQFVDASEWTLPEPH
nr:putative nucleotidyltransferase substrate binding domain-containing protein [Arsenicicoccus piscis]